MPYDIRNPSASLDLPIAGALAPGPINTPEQIHLAYGGSTPGSYGNQQAMYVTWNTGRCTSSDTEAVVSESMKAFGFGGRVNVCLCPQYSVLQCEVR